MGSGREGGYPGIGICARYSRKEVAGISSPALISLIRTGFGVGEGGAGQGGQLKFTIAETCERIKEEFNFLQAQYHTIIVVNFYALLQPRHMLFTLSSNTLHSTSESHFSTVSFPYSSSEKRFPGILSVWSRLFHKLPMDLGCRLTQSEELDDRTNLASAIRAMIWSKTNKIPSNRILQKSDSGKLQSPSTATRLKLECEKLASEKTEMQRHYVMYYEMSYGLNVEMHKQTEIAKRLNAIIAQVLPFLAQEHQQQVATAVERAKQVTMTELNAIIGQQQQQGLQQLLQQIHAQQVPHGPAGLPMGPPGLLGFTPPPHPLLKAADLHRDPPDHKGPPSLPEDRLRSPISPGEKYRPRSPEPETKRRKHEKLQPHSAGPRFEVVREELLAILKAVDEWLERGIFGTVRIISTKLLKGWTPRRFRKPSGAKIASGVKA
ncbi:hypothetical protein AAG570_006911 [Ranatra chinensis]|uniref:Groucho/TLE N-terminal Q-rich domain-containing protein n=1 Tax=Ranatra chinensis TaxID=642074 RepID=A0ABD0ZIS0_9HEMI